MVELLVVIAIIALLVSMLLPVIARARAASQQVRCAANLHALAQAVAAYVHDWKDAYPAGWHGTDTWVLALDPYLGRGRTLPLVVGHGLIPPYISPVFQCPMARTETSADDLYARPNLPSLPYTTYLSNSRVFPVFAYKPARWPKAVRTPLAGEQMMLAEGYPTYLHLRAWTYYGYIDGDWAQNAAVWATRDDILSGRITRQTMIIPWHGRYSHSNMLMADFHVKTAITPREGWEHRYQNPTLRQQSPPYPY